MDDGSSSPVELEELRDQIDLQRAIVASLRESFASTGLSDADSETLAVAETHLAALQSRMDLLDTQDERQAQGGPGAWSPGAWSPQLKTEAGPSWWSPIKSEPTSWRQPKTGMSRVVALQQLMSTCSLYVPPPSFACETNDIGLRAEPVLSPHHQTTAGPSRLTTTSMAGPRGLPMREPNISMDSCLHVSRDRVLDRPRGS